VGVQSLAFVAAAKSDARRAARLLGFADRGYERFEVQREPTEASIYERLLKLLQGQLPEGEIATLRAEGAALSEDQAVEEALRT
jgi:hypothetical protein